MIRAWLAGGLLAAMVGLALWHGAALTALTDELVGLLDRAETAAEAGDWAEAESLLRRAEEAWQRHGFYLHVTLRHELISQVTEGFGEVLELAAARDGAGYPAAEGRLRHRLGLLSEEERPGLENLL